jgi:hypothetical protein
MASGSCVLYSRILINIDCHVLRVQACWSCIDLDGTRYHAVDAGFSIVLELVIRWTRIRFNLIDLSSLAMFVPSPRNPIRLYNRILVIPSRVKHVHEFALNNVCFYPSMFRLYHAVDWSILGWWCDFKQVVSCGGLTCLMSCLTGLKVSWHAVD